VRLTSVAPAHRLTAEATLVSLTWPEMVAIAVRAPATETPRLRIQTAVGASPHAQTRVPPHKTFRPTLPGLRAPPHVSA
jgi:hypothetical protein